MCVHNCMLIIFRMCVCLRDRLLNLIADRTVVCKIDDVIKKQVTKSYFTNVSKIAAYL